MNSPKEEKSKYSIKKTVLKCVQAFCLYTSIHGFNHIAGPGRHWLERVLWAIVTSVAIWGTVDVSLGQLQRFNDNPTVVTLGKDFRSWEYCLPAITVCDKNRVDQTKLPMVINKLWKVSPTDDKYEYYKKYVTTVANSDLFRLEGYKQFEDDVTLNVDLLQLVIDVTPEEVTKISSSSDNINLKWIPVMTEAGVCFTTNTVAVADVAISKLSANDTKDFPLTCTYAAMNCFMMVKAVKEVYFFVHSPYDLPSITSSYTYIYPSLNRFTTLNVMETRTGQGVKALSPRRRACLYTDEPNVDGRQVYSTNTCRLSCRSRLAIKLCGCKPFYYFYEDGVTCTPAGMRCLAAHRHKLANLGEEKCVCSQQCVDATFREVVHEDKIWGGTFQSGGAVRYTVQPPRTRYTREIVFHFQDLVVSFGGAAGLFLGASFISFVEVFYFVVDRIWKTFVPEKPASPAPHVTKGKIQYEVIRIQEITSILEENRRFDDNFMLNHY